MQRRRAFVIKLLLLALFLGSSQLFVQASGEECPCPPEPTIGDLLQTGSIWPDLIELQRFFRRMGYYEGPCLGQFNSGTVRAIKRFQQAHGIPVTGIIDGPTWGAVGKSVQGTPVSMKPTSENILLLIDLSLLSLTVLVDGQPFISFPVAVGKPETPSPVGDWKIISKGKWSGGFGTRWLGLNVPWGKFGIHGTNKPWSIGRIESHGCIRMFNQDVESVYRWVRVGTPVHILGDPFVGRRVLLRGETGPDVFFLQKRLHQLKIYDGSIDGIYGYGTERAVLKFQTQSGLKRTGQIHYVEYSKLHLLTKE